MALDAHGRGVWTRIVDPIGRAMARIGITANGVTTGGLVLVAVAAGLVASDRLALGGWVLFFGGLADLFDGAVARASGRSSAAGAFYDSVADRVTDGMILSAIAWAVRDEPWVFALAALALVTAQVTSYVRAKAESVGATCHVGLFERGERAIVTMVGLVFHRWLLVPALVVLALGGTVTVLQRIVHVRRQLRATP